MIVMKFGGTSNQDANAMANVVNIVSQHRQQQPIVVISAIAQATNILEQVGKLSAIGNTADAFESLRSLFDRHMNILDALIKDAQRRKELRAHLSTSLKELEELVKGIAILRELTPRVLDTLYAYGELSSSRLVVGALQEKGVDAVWVDTKDFLITDDTYNSATPLMDVVEQRLNEVVRPLMATGAIPVTQGFIGVSSSGHRTTMGRESSDFSASIIGAAFHVKDIQIWTDVDGVLTADPCIVRSPKKVKILSFEEAFELSYFGAKVLHPQTMLPAMEKKIPIHIFNSRRPHLSGTSVTHVQPSTDEPQVKSIAYKLQLSVLEMVPRKRFSQYIFWEHIYNILTRYGIRTHLMNTSEYKISIVIDTKDVSERLLNDLETVAMIEVKRRKGLLCLVGKNIVASPALLTRVIRAMNSYPITFVSYGASNSSIAFIVEDAVVCDLLQKIHTELFCDEVNETLFESLESLPEQSIIA